MPALVPVVTSVSDPLQVLSAVVGWAYFFAWTFSFYPQVRVYSASRGKGLESNLPTSSSVHL